ncbi:MAG: exopolyphosphatase / guanosine-5-triphosphate,3-diphosphate pyrophosphatase [Miltoncostaeaceae bacterium]|nr:exopolyphosphatase / guanosine-5-triphosphate,3-diphosphate pyrophosphatase [Miltoncostaeaceae bacterium]
MSAGPRERLAVVDLGSNTTRLFLCDRIGPEGPEGERLTTITALRRGAGPDGTLAPEALARLDVALAGYGERLRAHRPELVVAVGTSAIRDAPNRAAADALVRHHAGVALTVISGEREAALAYRGARLAVDGDGPAMVIDVGGGSTELVRGLAAGPEGAVSLQVGAVRCTEALLGGDPPSPEELAALRDALGGPVRDALDRIGGPAPAVGVAGSATTLAAIHLGGYDPARVHRLRLTTPEVAAIAARLAAMPLAELRELPGLEPARAPVIVAGATVIATILEVAGLPDLLVSERDILDGAALAAREGALVGDLTTS